MRPEVAQFLLDLLQRQQVSVGAPDFDEVVGKIQEAKRELAKIMTNADRTNSK